MNELWRPVQGWLGLYEVSNLGRVKSLPRIIVRNHMGTRTEQPIKERILKPSFMKGYAFVGLHRNGKQEVRQIHRMVAEAFLGEPPADKPWALHGTNGVSDNSVSNLYWGDQERNEKDKIRDGTLLHGEKAPWAKLTESDVKAIRADTRPHKEIAADYPIGRAAVGAIKRRQTWSHLE